MGLAPHQGFEVEVGAVCLPFCPSTMTRHNQCVPLLEEVQHGPLTDAEPGPTLWVSHWLDWSAGEFWNLPVSTSPELATDMWIWLLDGTRDPNSDPHAVWQALY